MSISGSNYGATSQPQLFAGLPSLFAVSGPSSTPPESVFKDSAQSPQTDSVAIRYSMPTDASWGQTAGGDSWYQAMQANLSTSARPNQANPSLSADTWEGQMAKLTAQNTPKPQPKPQTWDDMAASALVNQTIDRQNKPLPINPSKSQGYQHYTALAQAIANKRQQTSFLSPEAATLAKQQAEAEQAAIRSLIGDQVDPIIPPQSELGSVVRNIVTEALKQNPESPQFSQIMGQLTLLSTKLPAQSAQLDDVAIIVKDATLVAAIKNSPPGRREAQQLERESLANRRALNQMLSPTNPAMNTLRTLTTAILNQKSIKATALDALETQFKEAAASEPLTRALAPKAYLLILDTAINQQLQEQLGVPGANVSPLRARKDLIASLYKIPNLSFDQLAQGMEKAPEYQAPEPSGFNMTQLMMMMAFAKK